jgi:hypothetical protein
MEQSPEERWVLTNEYDVEEGRQTHSAIRIHGA